MTVNERIRTRMRELGLKNKDLSNATKASKGTVSQWVNGGNGPSSQYITPLAKILQVTEQWLLQGGTRQTPLNNETHIRRVSKIPLLTFDQAGNGATS
ncbi:helix-turn-helix domain-containing protein [Arsenophonus sp. aPb]|uniref:helix-turn-helix domain-containing protein n=1 Tax=Arsenophonus sp. aPb TaxID=3041619 RepID=UPI0024691F7C|nr:helix-turn-helix domain-containing protein [Arsenophonus sp. aPb]WGL97265.1 helix-turn-helix domain-containing protein [Arsenophonus sp. aPb]